MHGDKLGSGGMKKNGQMHRSKRGRETERCMDGTLANLLARLIISAHGATCESLKYDCLSGAGGFQFIYLFFGTNMMNRTLVSQVGRGSGPVQQNARG